MRLARARIQNFRSIREITVDFGIHTAFIGPNGGGKSSILRAIEKFYSTAKTLETDDYYGRDTSRTVEIELTFKDLTEEEQRTFGNRVRGGMLTVTRVFDTSTGSGRYHGVIPQLPAFRTIRSEPNFSAKRTAYNTLRTSDAAFAALPTVNGAGPLEQALTDWETNHADDLVLERDDGQFFGFQNASRGALQRYTTFVFIPAVREAALDATDAKSSAIQQLLEIVVRSAVLQREDVVRFREEVNRRFRELTAPENMQELTTLGDMLTVDIRRLYEDAAVALAWRPVGEMPLPLPAADVTLSQDGFGGSVDRQGHGLQRAFVFTLLQQLAKSTHSTAQQAEIQEADAVRDLVEAAAPSLILAIEEPELYQHPTKQRHLASVLRKLSEGTLPGASTSTQIAFASHSPMFVSMPHVDEIRFVRRVDCGEGQKECEIRALDLLAVARKLEAAAGRLAGTFTAESLQARLHIVGMELSEGFFADGVVLVEGRSDKAALTAVADQMGVNFEAAGIAILSAEGKTCIDRPLLVFKELGIPTYPIWDCDTDKPAKDVHPEANLLLLRAMEPDANHNTAPTDTRVSEQFAFFSARLEVTLKAELGDAVYDSCLNAVCAEYGASGGDAQKNPEIMKHFLRLAAARPASSATLEEIVRQIFLALKGTDISAARNAEA